MQITRKSYKLYNYTTFGKKIKSLEQRRKPKLKNIELIDLNLTAEYMSIDTENHLFKVIPKKLTKKITRTVYNRRKQCLFDQIDSLLAQAFNEFEDTDLIDCLCQSPNLFGLNNQLIVLGMKKEHLIWATVRANKCSTMTINYRLFVQFGVSFRFNRDINKVKINIA